jgi:apolipoprotein D and lipocalin family protein
MKLVSLLLCLALVATSICTCPNVPVVSPFDLSEYLGIWYEISTSPTSKITFERDCFCTRANYTLESDGATVLVQNSCNLGSISGPVDIATGNATIPNPDEPAKISVTFGGNIYAPYWVIINEDYEYAVVWSCVSGPIVGINFEYMWVLARDNTISTAQYNALVSQAAELTGYDVSKLILTAQQGCTYPTST